MATNFFNGTIDLGNTPEMFAAYAHFGKLSPDLTYGMLHGSLHAVLAGFDAISDADLADVANDALAFKSKFGDELDDHANWILDQLIAARKRPRPNA